MNTKETRVQELGGPLMETGLPLGRSKVLELLTVERGTWH